MEYFDNSNGLLCFVDSISHFVRRNYEESKLFVGCMPFDNRMAMRKDREFVNRVKNFFNDASGFLH